MKKETLSQQWDALMQKLEDIEKSDIDKFFETNYKPEGFFKVEPSGNIKKIEVKDFNIRYCIDGKPIFPPFLNKGKKPSSQLVSGLLRYIENIQKCEKRIGVVYKDFGVGAYEYEDITKEKGLSFNRTDLELEAEQRREMYAPREGYSPCQYCRKQVPTESMISSIIIGRGRSQVWNSWKGVYESKACVTRERLMFCSSKCAGNEQMSREG